MSNVAEVCADESTYSPPSVPLTRPALSHTLSPGTESNHDSCYDSDSSSVDSRRNSSQPDWHSDVSRTTSDTLAAEHSDADDAFSKRRPHLEASHLHRKLTSSVSSRLTEPQSKDAAPKEASPPSVSGAETTDSNYESKVEFALKLGYTEKQLQTALFKLGSNVNQNTLLNELIRLGSSEEGGEDEDEEEEEAEDEEDRALTVHVVAGTTSVLEGVSEEALSEKDQADPGSNLRPIVIDGSNVAMR